MPRWPGGLHAASGSGVAYGYRPIRPPATPQRQYWRQTRTELFAGANAVISPGLTPAGAPVSQIASVGPAAAGERWECRVVQVTITGLYGTPPQVTVQQSAQTLGTMAAPPPPLIAQAWLSAGGTNVHLLAQTTQGGYDTLDLGGQVVTAGEAITVLWWSVEPPGPAFPGFGWMAVRGTRYALSVT